MAGEVFRVGLPSGVSRLVQVTGLVDIKGGITSFRVLPGRFADQVPQELLHTLVQSPAEAVLTSLARFDVPGDFEDVTPLGVFQVPRPVEQVEALRGFWTDLVYLTGGRVAESWAEALELVPGLRPDRAPMDIVQQRDVLYAGLEDGMDAESGLPVGFQLPEEPDVVAGSDVSFLETEREWGSDPAPWFDNDLAMDYVAAVQKAGSWEPVQSSLEDPDLSEAPELIAAAGLVACAVTDSLGLDVGINDLRAVLDRPEPRLIDLARKVTRRVREADGTEWHLSIREAPGDLYAPWLDSLGRLEQHLADAAQ